MSKTIRDHYIDFDDNLQEWNNEALLVADMFGEAEDLFRAGVSDFAKDKLKAALGKAEEACFLANDVISSFPKDPEEAFIDEQGE